MTERRPLGMLVLVSVLLVAACSGFPSSDPVSGDGGTAPTETDTAPITGSGSMATTVAGDDAVAPVGTFPTDAACVVGPPRDGPGGFEDATAGLGVDEPLRGMRAHAAAWGDVDGDGWVDLFVGTFADRSPDTYAVRGAAGPSPDRLLLGGAAGFVLGPQLPVPPGRTSGAAFADLDDDGDLDLIVVRNTRDAADGPKGGPSAVVLENVDGVLDQVHELPLPKPFRGRSVGIGDLDLDGDLDLVVLEDRYGSAGTRILRGDGALGFVDATAAFGLEDGVPGLGVVVVDLDGDGLLDVAIADTAPEGARWGVWRNEGEDLRLAFEASWEGYGDEDILAGIAAGDVDRDGRLDLVVGHHFNSTVDRDTEVPVRLYRNVGGGAGEIAFEDVTDVSGLVPLPTKAPHVELVDVDNDGRLDILTSASADDGTAPAVFRARGDGTFMAPAGLGSDAYWVAAPTADVDRDGRLDVIALEWEPALPSRMFLGRSAAGGWLDVVVPRPGAVVHAETSGGVVVMPYVNGVGYSAGVASIVHVGLGRGALQQVSVAVPGAAPLLLSPCSPAP